MSCIVADVKFSFALFKVWQTLHWLKSRKEKLAWASMRLMEPHRCLLATTAATVYCYVTALPIISPQARLEAVAGMDMELYRHGTRAATDDSTFSNGGLVPHGVLSNPPAQPMQLTDFEGRGSGVVSSPRVE